MAACWLRQLGFLRQFCCCPSMLEACVVICHASFIMQGTIGQRAMSFLPCPVPYFEIAMPISRLLMQFRMGCHALPIEQTRLARPAIPRHLRRCTLCKTRALGDERHFLCDCPHFAHIRRRFCTLYQIHQSIQPALAYEDASLLESSAKLRMAARQWQTAFWSLCHTKHCMVPSAS